MSWVTVVREEWWLSSLRKGEGLRG
jgi:hypothetical protein